MNPRRLGLWALQVALTLAAWNCASAAVCAETLDGVEAPLIRVNIKQGNVTIRTWDKPSVQFEADPEITTRRFTANIGQMAAPVPILEGRIPGPHGQIILPGESFVISTLPPGPREIVTFNGEQGNLSVTIPNSTALVVVVVVRGNVSLSDYRGGTFVTRVRNGSTALSNVGGDGFVQVLHGPIIAGDSNFNRLRARGAVGNLVFERCRVRQIEASSVEGSIVYDGGSFEPGLARFESMYGNVAVGVSSGAQLSARSANGRVFTMFDRRAQIESRPNDATALIEGGGPLVTATSGSGSVFLYDGSLRGHRSANSDWGPAQALLQRATDRAHIEVVPVPPPPRPPPHDQPLTRPPNHGPPPHRPPPPHH